MYIANQQCRNICSGGKAHVGEVAIAEIDFARAARTLDDDQIGLRRHTLETVEDCRHELRAVPEIDPRRHRGLALALNDDLRAGGGFGLQQYGVHVHTRFGSRCPGL